MPTIWDIEEAERAQLNPWADPEFNFCTLDPVMPEDIAERVGLASDNVSIEINEVEGMTFLKLDDTPEAYGGHDKKYVQVQGEQLAFKKVSIPKVDASNLVYRDLFRDESVHWTWEQWLGASATGKSITEEDDYIKLDVTATTHARWDSSDNEAPKIIIGTPGFPYEIICHLSTWSDNNLSRTGIFLSKNVSGTGADTTLFFHRTRNDGASKDGLQVTRMGAGELAYVGWTDNDAWFRIRVGAIGFCNSNIVFSYSSDGDSWTDLHTLTVGVPLTCGFPVSVPDLVTGCYATNWAATYAAVSAKFDHFEMRRILGPDGGS